MPFYMFGNVLEMLGIVVGHVLDILGMAFGTRSEAGGGGEEGVTGSKQNTHNRVCFYVSTSVENVPTARGSILHPTRASQRPYITKNDVF